MAREFKTGYKVTGDASGAVRAAQATRGELDKLNRSIENQTKVGSLASGSIGKYAAGIAGAATVAAGAVFGIARFAKSIADQGDRVQKLAIQLGTSTEFISGMGYAADLSGSSLEGFAKGMAKMERSVADLGDGLSTQVIAFERLGLTYEDLKNLSPEDQFLKTASSIGAMEDKTLRTATAMQIFGRSGAELIPLFAEGEEGISAMRAEAERLGLVMSQDFADASAQFNDNMTRATGVVTGIKRQVAEGLLPTLSALAERFVESANATDTWENVGEFLGNMVRVLVAGFTILKETVVLVAETIWAAGKVIVDTLQAITAPFTEFVASAGQALRALAVGDFEGAAEAFTGLGDRIAKSFKDNMGQVQETMKQFGVDAKDRIVKAVGDVNDILTRQATVSEGAAESMEELADQTNRGAKEAEAAEKAFGSLVDRLDPLTKLQRTFTVEQALLNAKIAEGGNDVLYYEGLLIQLQAEYARSKAEATGWGQAAEDAGQRAVDAAERATEAAARETERREKELQKQLADVETFEKAWTRGIERMDDTMADLWRGMIDGSADAMDTIKSFFQNWLAEMAHAAITRPILVQFQNALGGLGGGGGGGFLSSIGGLFGAGQSAAGAGGATGATGAAGAAGASAAAGPFGWIAAAVITNYLLAQKGWTTQNLDTSGNTAALGAGALLLPSGFEATAGVLLADKLARSIGISDKWSSILSGGAVLSKLFGHKDPKVQSTGLRGTFGFDGVDGEAFANIVAKGGWFRSDKKWQETDAIDGEILGLFDDVIDTIGDYAKELAEMAQVDISEALANTSFKFDITLDADPEKAEQQIRALAEKMGTDLITATADAFGPGVAEFVSAVSSIDGQLDRLTIAARTVSLINGEIGLAGHTFEDFLVVAKSMKRAGEDVNQTFERLFDQIISIVSQLESLRGYSGSDLVSDYDTIVQSQGLTIKQVTDGLASDIRELQSAYTGSADDLSRLSSLVIQRYQSEIAYLQQIDQIVAGISGGFQNLKDTIEQDLFGSEAFYDKITSQAEQLAADLRSMTDPSQIAATVAEIQRLTGIAYNLLDDAGKQTNGQGFLDFIEGVESDAADALQLARDLFIEESEVLRGLVTEMADQFADPLEIAARAHEFAAQALEDAGDNMNSAASAMGSVAGQLVAAVRDGIKGIANDLAPAAGGTTTIPTSSALTASPNGAQNTANAIAQSVATAVTQAGHSAAEAIQTSVGGITVIVQQPGRGMANI